MDNISEMVKSVQSYTNGVRTGTVVTIPETSQSQNYLGYSKKTNLEILVADRDKIGNGKYIREIAQTSLDIAYSLDRTLHQSKLNTIQVSLEGIPFSISTFTPKLSPEIIFKEGAMHILISPNSSDIHSQYDTQLNFRKIQIGGQEKLAVIVESIHKGAAQERHIKNKLKNGKQVAELRADEQINLAEINAANTYLGNIEKKFKCSMAEMSFQIAFAFARAIGADYFMATDDQFVSTKRLYEDVFHESRTYAEHNWIFKKYGLHPPEEGGVYWINPYPDRLQESKLTLRDTLFFYQNTTNTPPDHNRQLPRSISQSVVEYIAAPYEAKLSGVFATDRIDRKV